MLRLNSKVTRLQTQCVRRVGCGNRIAGRREFGGGCAVSPCVKPHKPAHVKFHVNSAFSFSHSTITTFSSSLPSTSTSTSTFFSPTAHSYSTIATASSSTISSSLSSSSSSTNNTMAPASQYYADTKAPVTPLEVKQHFELLSDKDKLYAHHMSRYVHTLSDIYIYIYIFSLSFYIHMFLYFLK